WSVRRVLGAASTVRVYPNFAALVELAGLSVELASRSVGARLQRRRGEGTEFQELRDYRVGDSLRKIDWKATARSSRLISREYRDERNQQVVLMLDCGRRLLAQDDRRVHFDHVLNASLALASIALRRAMRSACWPAPASSNAGCRRNRAAAAWTCCSAPATTCTRCRWPPTTSPLPAPCRRTSNVARWWC